MLHTRLGRFGGTMTALVVIIASLVLADLVFAGVLVARQTSVHLAPAAAQASPKVEPEKQARSAHPCNHGFYVSQAAHSKKGGAYVSGIAQSDLGRDGNCAAPLPAPAPTATPPPKRS